MKTKDVKKLPAKKRFIYWMTERHNIFLKRKAGAPKPWTDDEILQSQFFTNPFRENDRVTVWFRENIRDPLSDSEDVIFATILFRWFNLPFTAEVLIGDKGPKHNLFLKWDPVEAQRRLDKARAEGNKLFTGAYIINCQNSEPKHTCCIRRVTKVWEDRKGLITFVKMSKKNGGSMRDVHKFLLKYDGLGPFMAYEIVCDLRYTDWLNNARDRKTWCNPGPGAVRGLHRINGGDFASMGIKNNAGAPKTPKDFIAQCQNLLAYAQGELRAPAFRNMEMREIEHSLCEWDKFERVLWGEGRSKRRYQGT